MPYVTVLTACFNEEENIREVHRQVADTMRTLPNYEYEHLFIDNASQDHTVDILREIAAEDRHVRVIVNTRNFGHVRSPHYALLQASGEAVITCVADLQDPPELIPRFIEKWEEGYKIAIGVKTGSRENKHMFRVRRLFYRIMGWLSEVEQIPNFTGFGLYDREVIEHLRQTNEQYVYFRGLICDFGYERAEIGYEQPAREKGSTHNSLYTLFDLAMLGITNHSKVPLRIATVAGFSLSVFSAVLALGYLVLKLMFWNAFGFGLAPMLIGIYFFGSVQLFFIGILGEYVGSIHTQLHKRPLVIEKERINFD